MSTCRYCGVKDLVWKGLGGGLWRLYTAAGERHGCQGKPARAPVVVKGKTIVGPLYQPFAHAPGCSAVPWEDCSCRG